MCPDCGAPLEKVDPKPLGLGVFAKYDNIVLMCGLNLDKRIINEKFRSTPRYTKILTSNISDSQLLEILFYSKNFDGESPFSSKNVILIYGDGPYTFNNLVENMYLKIPEEELAGRLQNYTYSLAENGMWGWEILSFVLKKYLELARKESLYYVVEVPGGDDSEERRGRLEFLMRMAAPPSRAEEREIIVSDTREVVGYRGVVAVPVYRFLPSFRDKDSREPVRELLESLDGDTAVVTIGGPEHNIFLNFFTAERRSLGPDQVIFDGSNVFDLEAFRREPQDKVLLDTHTYVGFRLLSRTGKLVIMSREDPRTETGGLILKLQHKSELFGNRPFDLFAIIGAGLQGALATKLTFTRLLLDSARRLLDQYGIYYVTFNRQRLREVYSRLDIVHFAKNVAALLEEEELERASQVYAVV
jgi:hypothetical protein